MRLLWIAIVLALFECSYGQQQEETATIDPKLLNEYFDTNDLPGLPENNPNETETGTGEDPDLTPKISNVS